MLSTLTIPEKAVVLISLIAALVLSEYLLNMFISKRAVMNKYGRIAMLIYILFWVFAVTSIVKCMG